ncbi:unnamed protein product [Phytophthora fragariaefolia]|uniref:Unnamed protein product n=1 Tax=Phytophthora fragariaefolia TaxID=1490495 RepID=A0A9W6U450_9STRA|nr:unnamed protein product [Phytophthora fragariaefolia]
MMAGSAHVEEGAGVVARANKSGRVGAPTTQGVVASSARATEDAGACARATTSGGRAGAPISKAIKGDKVTSTPKAEASSRDADSADEERELSYVEVLDSFKAGELAEVVLLRPEGGAMEFNPSSVMDSDVLEDERTSKRQTRYGAAILKDPSDPYHPLLKEFSDVVSDDPLSILPPDRGVRHEIDLVPGTKYYDIFVHSRASKGKAVVEAHLGHLREVLLCMRENHLYPNINKCIFGAEEIPFLGCFHGKDGVRADPENVCAIAQWPVPVSQKALRKWLGLTNYLHKYSANYADMARPLSNLLKKGGVWSWTSEAQQAFEAIKRSLQSAPILALPDEDRPFSVGSLFPLTPIEGGRKELPRPRQRTVGDEVRLGQVSGAPVRSKTLCDLHRSCLFEDGDVVASPLPAHGAVFFFFAKYNFTVEYKPGKQNGLADALSRRTDYELAHLTYLGSPLYELIRETYAGGDDLAGLVELLSVPSKTVGLTARQRSRLHRYSIVEGLIYYQVDVGDEPRIVVPNDEDLRRHVLYEAHDTPLSGHLGREKTYTSVARNFWRPHMYKWVRKYIRTC